MPKKPGAKKEIKPLTDEEMEQISVVFHQYETGVRSGVIKSQDLLNCMKNIGLISTEQEIIDMTNEVEKKGVIYFEDYCKLILRKFREEDELEFIKIMFKHLCGTDPHPTAFRARKYKVHERFIEKKDFLEMMQNLPVPVDPADAEEMFKYADKDRDDKISWTEFQIMINPPPPPKPPTPHKQELVNRFIIENPAFQLEEELVVEGESLKVEDGSKVDKEDKEPGEASEEQQEEKKEEKVEEKKNPKVEKKEHSPKSECDDGSKNHRKHCAICQSKDSTSIQYSWRNDKGTFVEKEIQVPILTNQTGEKIDE